MDVMEFGSGGDQIRSALRGRGAGVNKTEKIKIITTTRTNFKTSELKRKKIAKYLKIQLRNARIIQK